MKPVPEPSSLALLGMRIAGLLIFARKCLRKLEGVLN
ncbi:PEP-CTERM sorting domain-containing protein [Thalassoglobus neptunius]